MQRDTRRAFSPIVKGRLLAYLVWFGKIGAGGAPQTPSSGALHLFNGFISHGLGTNNTLLFDLAVKDCYCYISALTLDVYQMYGEFSYGMMLSA